MLSPVNLNILLSNIINENTEHCRLCLNAIEEGNYFSFTELPLNVIEYDCPKFQKISEIAAFLLNDDSISNEDIPGINAVCGDCVYKIQIILKFIEQCQQSTSVLHKVVENVTKILDSEDEVPANNNLYLHVDEDDCVATLSEKVQKKRKSKRAICRKCDDTEFFSQVQLRIHSVMAHGTCDICHIFLKDEIKKNDHLQNMQKCSVCDEIKCSEESFKDHWDKCHSECICKTCGKTLQGLEKLKLHELKHKMQQECPKCGKCYTTTEFFSKHVELCLSNQLVEHPMRSRLIKNYKCDECGKAYSTHGSLRVHERFAHGGATGHKCLECGKVFTAPSYLKMHQITHTKEKNFKCEICSNRFVTKEALLYHTRRHTGEKPYKCIHCNECFVNASARAEHIKYKHIGPTLSCHICSRKFVTQNFLKHHISRHSDPTSKLYTGRSKVPANIPDEKNLRVRKLHLISRHSEPTTKLYTGRSKVPANIPDEKRVPILHLSRLFRKV